MVSSYETIAREFTIVREPKPEEGESGWHVLEPMPEGYRVRQASEGIMFMAW